MHLNRGQETYECKNESMVVGRWERRGHRCSPTGEPRWAGGGGEREGGLGGGRWEGILREGGILIITGKRRSFSLDGCLEEGGGGEGRRGGEGEERGRPEEVAFFYYLYFCMVLLLFIIACFSIVYGLED